MKFKFLKSNKHIGCLFLALNLLTGIETYSQTHFDTSGKWVHSFCFGMPIHKFPEFDKFKIPQFERNAAYHSSLPIYWEYGIAKNNSNIRIYYYYYSWLRIYDDFNHEFTEGTLATRGFGLLNLSYIRSVPVAIKNKKILELDFGLNMPYRFDGMDEIFLFRIPPFGVKSDAIFYKRLGIGFNCGLHKQFFKRFQFVVRYNYQYFNEPAHSYPVKGLTNYGPNRKMNVLQFGLGYSINHKNLIGLFKKKDS
jgi:hypothetical protein